jgi:hypothetical protein
MATAVSVVVHDVDISAASTGSAIVVPVEVRNLVPAEFMAFQFEFSYDPAKLAAVDVVRGPLISQQNTGLACAGYSPYLWGLEHTAGNGVIRVGGAIVLEGVRADYDNLVLFNQARVAQSKGILLNLQFTLLSKARTVVSLVSPTTTCLMGRDELSAESTAATESGTLRSDGGPLLDGLPNWWQLDYFDALGVDETADPDNDGAVNLREYQADTDPHTPDVRLRLDAGWNLFSLPIVPDDPAVEAVMAAANSELIDDGRRGRDAETVHIAPVYGLTRTASGAYRFTRIEELQALTAYWVYVPQSVYLFVTGTVPPHANLTLRQGWNLIGPRIDCLPQTVTRRNLPCFGWNAGELKYEPRNMLTRGAGHWLYSREDNAQVNLWDAP